MQKPQKRKQLKHQLQSSSNKPPTKSAKTENIINGRSTEEPYPGHPRPTPEECRAIRDDLLALHGFPQEFAKYRKLRPSPPDDNSSLLLDGLDRNTAKLEPLDGVDGGGSSSENVLNRNTVKSEPLDGVDGDGSSCPKESVLDGLVSTILSQNTTDVNSQRAFASLKSAFPTWEDVLAAESRSIENAIRCGGLAATKVSCIKNILSSLLEKNGKLCLEYLRQLSIDEIKAELFHFKGVGPKTVACVLMFHLQQDDFPVDTHVFQIAKAIGWVPAVTDRKKTYFHLNRRIPNDLKFDLNCLLFTHGKLCQKCTEKGGNLQRAESHENSCPLLKYCENSDLRLIKKID
ncbi:hypothetical protein L1049_028243 [Liquidambar formosana]|uniref:HhH-GPD domain-containing protein n=1 Tax=Liquidambar formosana TaxID=63359 RepID=A0AAP0RIL0_LIQFO